MAGFIAKFKTDEELKNILLNLDELPEDLVLYDRVFVEVPIAKWEKCPKSLGKRSEKMNSKTNGFYKAYKTDKAVGTVLGATMKSIHGKPTGGYDKPFPKEVVKAWVKELGIDAFHVAQPISSEIE